MFEISLTYAFVALFASVALVTGSLTYVALERSSPARRRIRDLLRAAAPGSLEGDLMRVNAPGPALQKVQRFIPKSPKEMSKLQRRLAIAGFHKSSHAVVYSLCELGGALIGFLVPLMILGWTKGLIFGVLGGVVGYLVPSFVLDRRIRQRQKAIENGLPDALDLFIVCLEA